MTTTALLSSQSFYGPALSGLSRAVSTVSNSSARLASGNRLINAGDDVAALSISMQLQSQGVGIRTAKQNALQASSFLQVAYDGLLNIRDLLDRQQALATQAGSGTLTDTDREFLHQEFTALKEEIDRIAGSTRFGGITLLNGEVSGQNAASTVTSQATRASGTVTLTGVPVAGQTVRLNGVDFVAGTDFAIGTLNATTANLAQALTDSTNPAISQATYEASGNIITITQKAGGTLGNRFIIDQANSTASIAGGGGATQVANVFTLQGGVDNGLRAGSVEASGTIGDALVTAQSQTSGSVVLTLSGAVSDGEQLRIDNGNGGFVNFTFRNAPTLPNEILIGADTEETLQNAVAVMTQYAETDNYGVRQLEFQRNGSQLIISNRDSGNPTDLTGAVLDVAETITNGSLSAATITGGTNTGINAGGVVNADFAGVIQGFSATYTGADALTASLTVGGSTYTATISDTTPGADTSVRFSSASGGYFDVRMASGGLAVGSQGDADEYAARLDGAFATMNFYQSRNVSSFSGTGSLAGASAELRSDDFSGLRIEGIRVAAPTTPGGDGVIEVDIGGETFRSASGIGGSLGARESFTLTSTTDGNKTLRLTAGSVASDFSTEGAAESFTSTLRDSFGLNETGPGLNFQVGPSGGDFINVIIGDARSSTLYAGVSPSIATQLDAAAAATTLSDASDRISQILADVGALQQRFDTASGNLETWRSGVETARSNLADTDIAEESTRYATATLQANAAAAVIAQAMRLQSSMVDILKFAA